MTWSLRRTLAVRFAATMAVALVGVAAVAFWATSRVLRGQLDQALQGDLLVALAAVVVLGTGATLVGAWYLAGSAVRPVGEITAQATRIEAGTLNQRIAAHADTEEYRGLVAVLNRMLDRLDRAFQAQQRFAADVGHEFRSPLTALRGEMEVALRAERSPREYQRVLHSALEEIERLTLVTEDLLWLTRAESALVAARPMPTDVNSLVDAALEARRGAGEEKGLTVRRAFGYPDGGLAVDPALVTKLLSELLDNAMKFAPFGGDVVVGTEPLADGIRLFVEDSGPGIAPEVFPHLFEPFYRADEARTRGTGTGLGLTIAQTITRLHGGQIRAANRPEGGARFEVDLPASTTPSPASV